MDHSQKSSIDLSKYILLIDNRKQQRLIKPTENKNFKWRKINIKLQQLQKFEYYDYLEVGNDKLTKSEEQFDQQQELDDDEEQQQVFNSNNKEIYTLQNAQKLQAEEINELKATKNANQIISAIVSNNQQFDKRTAYSKQKYLAKKKKKYMFRIHAEVPNLENVHNYYFQTQPKNIGYIRWDMFGFMLLQGSPYKNVLLAQKTKGLLLASLIQRQAKRIIVCSDEAKTLKRYPIVEQLNIAKQKAEQVTQFMEWKNLAQKIENKEIDHYFSNVMMLGNYNFQEIIQKIQPSLAAGCIICFHCQNVQPLHAALNVMKTIPSFIHIKLYDMWAREYQVLKNRTHPMMYMSSHSGYLLTAIKLD